ncbi:MAG TPA: phosphotransferase [Acidimicrobiia bacterium]|nr:phosphotransferase [Acidimicrobiia bacterium]
MIGPQPIGAVEMLALLGRATNERIVITKLAGGYRNFIHRVEGEDLDCVVKQYAPPDDNPLFPLLFEDEWRSLSAFEQYGIAPRLIATDPDRRLLAYRFIPGDVWDGDLVGLGALLSKVGQVPAPGWLRKLPSGVGELRAHTIRILAEVADPPGGLLDHFDVPEGSFPTRLVHTDCGPGNVIGGSGQYVLVDWQCPGRGDPVEDLAAATSPGVQILYGRVPLGKADVDELLVSYGDANATERYRWKAPLYSARFAAYCAWRIERLSQHSDADRYREALAAELEFLES